MPSADPHRLATPRTRPCCRHKGPLPLRPPPPASAFDCCWVGHLCRLHPKMQPRSPCGLVSAPRRMAHCQPAATWRDEECKGQAEHLHGGLRNTWIWEANDRGLPFQIRAVEPVLQKSNVSFPRAVGAFGKLRVEIHSTHDPYRSRIFAQPCLLVFLDRRPAMLDSTERLTLCPTDKRSATADSSVSLRSVRLNLVAGAFFSCSVSLGGRTSAADLPLPGFANGPVDTTGSPSVRVWVYCWHWACNSRRARVALDQKAVHWTRDQGKASHG